MDVANAEIRKAVAAAGLRYWQLAAEVGINRGTLCEWLRFPLTKERRDRVEAAIEKLTKEGTEQ